MIGKVGFDSIDTTNPKDLLGAKKVAMDAVSPVAIAHEACAMMDGEWKYGYRNWREKKVRARVYVAAAKRHLDEWLEGTETAADSGVHHLGHARACLGIILDAQESGNLIDDRVPGPFSKVLEKLGTWVVERSKHYADKKAKDEERKNPILLGEPKRFGGVLRASRFDTAGHQAGSDKQSHCGL